MGHAHLACTHGSTADALQRAETICVDRGGRLTPLRRRVLELLLEADGPVKAYDLLAALGDASAAKPPSVYRSLEFLLDMGLAHKIESLNAFIACGHWDHGHAAVFLICETCGAAGELHSEDAMRRLAVEVAAMKFRMRSAIIEIRGMCADCVARAADKPTLSS
jgi:Fur family zinc uptake transcriptional regulator